MGRGLIAALLGVLVISLVGAGCGDDSSLTKAEFIQQGDAICAKAESKKNADLEAAFKKQVNAGKPMNKAFEQNLVTTVALPPVVSMTEELATLDAPDEDAEAIVSAYESSIEGIEENPSSVLDGSNPFEEADKLAANYGFKACAEI